MKKTFTVWKRPDFGEFAAWRIIKADLSEEAATDLEKKIHREDCDCTTTVLPEGEKPIGYEAEQSFLRRGY